MAKKNKKSAHRKRASSPSSKRDTPLETKDIDPKVTKTEDVEAHLEDDRSPQEITDPLKDQEVDPQQASKHSGHKSRFTASMAFIPTQNTSVQSIQLSWRARFNRLLTWYRALSLSKKVLWGLVTLPVLALLFFINLLILPFLPMIGGVLLTLLKGTFVITKLSAFVIYIGYKVVKTFLGFYYCISRTLSGQKSHKWRVAQSRAVAQREPSLVNLELEGALSDLALRTSWKRMHLSSEEADIDVPILFSYLRYFLLGQKRLYAETWRERRGLLTLWRAESRGVFKDQLQWVGKTIFTPYSVGPHLSKTQLLIPGDAKITSIKVEGSTLSLDVEVPWKTWAFSVKRWPFAISTLHTAHWQLTAPKALQNLSDPDQYHPEMVLNSGEASKDAV
jgi:hypothetical protein